jgi:GH35 family endo-1,4-beta-xylanase
MKLTLRGFRKASYSLLWVLIAFEILLTSIYLACIFFQGEAYPAFDMDGGMSIPSLFQALQLLLGGLISLSFFIFGNHSSLRPSRLFWFIIGLLFVYTSIDEVFKIHHLLYSLKIQNWTTVYLLIGLTTFVALYRDIITLWRFHRRSTFLMALGIGIFVVGGFGLEIVKQELLQPLLEYIFPPDNSIPFLVEKLRVATEEFSEMLGGSIILYGMSLSIWHKRRHNVQEHSVHRSNLLQISLKFLPLFLISSILIAIALPNFAAEDDYHQWLRNQIQELTEGGISAKEGTWVFGNNENYLQWSDKGKLIKSTDTANANDSSFKTWQIKTSSTARWEWGPSYERRLLLPSKAAIKKNDVVLVSFWVKSMQAEVGNGLLKFSFRQGNNPWLKKIYETYITPTPNWQLWLIPFRVNRDLPVSFNDDSKAGYLDFWLGQQNQTLKIGGVAVLNYGNKDKSFLEKLRKFKTTFELAYPNIGEPNAAWRSEAQKRIEQIRKANLTVIVKDKNGNLVPNAKVTVQMQKHAFPFGTAVSRKYIIGYANPNKLKTDQQIYNDKLLNLDGQGHGFNMASPDGLKWMAWDNDWKGFNRNKTAAQLDYLLAKRMQLRGHTLVWQRWGSKTRQIPKVIEDKFKEIEAKDKTAARKYLRQAILDHIDNEAGDPRVSGKIAAWDVINEPYHNNYFFWKNLKSEGKGEFDAIAQIYKDWLERTAQNDPNAKLFINDNRFVSQGCLRTDFHNYHKQVIQTLKAVNAPLDGLGFQAHIDKDTPLCSPQRLWQTFDQFAAEGMEIQITELDMKLGDEKLEGKYMEDFLVACFSHKAVTAFQMWGFWDGDHWKKHAPIFRKDWSMRPSGKRFIDLVFKQWWTDVSGFTNSQGQYSVPGKAFKGDYAIAVRYGGQTQSVEKTLINDETVTVTLD